MANADFIRVAIAAHCQGDTDPVSVEEREAVMNQVPDSLLRLLDPDDHDQMLFMRTFSDYAIMFWRIQGGDINTPIAGGRAAN